MANEKELKSRLLQKHDTEENWNKATNFVPKAGEIIVYDDNNPKIKIGDGTKTVTNLEYASNVVIIDADLESNINYNNILDKINKGLSVYFYLSMAKTILPYVGMDVFNNDSLKFIGPISVDAINTLDAVYTISKDNTYTLTYKANAPIVLTVEIIDDETMTGIVTSNDSLIDIVRTMFDYPTPPAVFLSNGYMTAPVIQKDDTVLMGAIEVVQESVVGQLTFLCDLSTKIVTVTETVAEIPTKDSLGLGNVENKSSATIREELTKANVVAALGYTPPEQDTNTTYENATSSTAGLMSAADKDKLDKIAAGATANVGTITGVTAGSGLTGGGTSGSVTLNVGAGTGITVAANTVGVKLKSATALTNDATAATETSGRVYPVAVDKSGNLAVNVPWTDTDTTYTLGSFGVTATAAELNKLDGVTASTAEINKLKGLTATTTELNYVDGVTSNIQEQLNSKVDTNTTYSISKSGSTITLTGSDGSTTSVTDSNTTSFTITAAASDDDVVILSGTNGSNKVTYSASHATKGPSTTASTTKGATADVTVSGSAASGSIKVPKVTVDKYGHTTGLTEQTLSITMPTIPTSLKNPSALTFTGAVTGSYDGSAAKTVNIPTIPSSLKNPNALTVGSKTYDGSSAVSITAADLGLSAAMKFLGTSATAITDGATTNPITIGTTSTTVSSGNVVLYGSKEFVWNGSSWEELGNEGSYKVVQAAVSSPTASGTATAFIDTISQDTNGKITATKKTVATATTSAAGLMSSADKTKLDGIATGATANTGTITGVSANGTSVATSGVANIPAATTSKYGVTKLSSATNSTSTSLAATASAVKAAYDLAASKASTDVATTSANGLMSSSDKTKLNGIATGAEVNQNAFSNITIGSTTIAADAKTDTLTLVAGSNVTLTPDATNDKITIAATDTTYSAASQSAAGLMSAADKKKLDGIATGATANTGTITGVTAGNGLTGGGTSGSVSLAVGAGTGISVAADTVSAKLRSTTALTNDSAAATETAGRVYPVAVDKSGYLAVNVPWTDSDTTYSAATQSAAGLMSAADKKKLDGVATGATANTGTITGVSANGTSVATSGVANIPAASTSVYGVTKLSSATNSTSTALAATASAVKAAYDLANSKAGTAVATTSANGLMSATDKTKLNNTNIAYATCSTAAATAAKVATITGNSNWTLTVGSIIGIKFTETNTASNPTINVNSTGAKSVLYGTAAITTSSLSYAGYANRTILYMYDGTNYVFLGWSYDANTDTKVTQANTTADTTYNVLLSYGAASTTSVTNAVKKSANMTFNPSTKTLTVANVSGNASSATKLATARTINGVSFDGTANITVPSSVTIGTITLTASGWTNDSTLGAYKQTATISGLSASHKVDLDADLNTINLLPASIVPYNDNGTFYAVTTTPPSVDIAVQYTLLATN